MTFEAQPGTTTAIVGPSGAGKTTAVRLLQPCACWTPKQGRVTIDGLDMREVRQADLRGAVALVPQDVALFNDTLYANIAFARPRAPPATREVRAAAEAAEAWPLHTTASPNGMSTMVGERGLKALRRRAPSGWASPAPSWPIRAS